MPENVERSLNVNAKTIDEAIERGLAQLGLPRDQVEVEIIKEGKRGVFGLGSEDAQVRLTPRGTASTEIGKQVESAASELAAEISEPSPSLESDTIEAEASSQTPTADERPDTDSAAVEDQSDDVETVATKYLSDLLALMGIEAEITSRMSTDLVEEGERPVPVLDITGKDLGILIGRRSETLRALQYMVRLMVSKHTRSWQPIIVDVESYRVRRRRSIRQMAKRMAERAVATHKKVVMEAMPAYERRIVHITLKDDPQVFTKSVGSDDNRKVTIIPK